MLLQKDTLSRRITACKHIFKTHNCSKNMYLYVHCAFTLLTMTLFGSITFSSKIDGWRYSDHACACDCIRICLARYAKLFPKRRYLGKTNQKCQRYTPWLSLAKWKGENKCQKHANKTTSRDHNFNDKIMRICVD